MNTCRSTTLLLLLPLPLLVGLLTELDAQYRSSDLPPQFSATRNLHFVTHPRGYTLLHNSNHVTATWLRALGVEVHGNPALGGWQLDTSSRNAAAEADVVTCGASQ